MKYRNKVFAVLLVAVLTAVPLAGCSKKAAPASAGDLSSGGQGDASSQTRIVGKVTSVIGNQVVLAVGTLKNAGGFGGRSESSGGSGSRTGASGGTGSASSRSGRTVSGSAASGGQSGGTGFSSADLSLTGETQTLLIPVGLTLSSGNSSRKSGASQPGGSAGRSAGGAAGGSFGGSTGGSFGGGSGGFGGGSGGTSRSGGTGNSGSRNGGSAGGTPAGTAGSTLATLQRSQDFSSIKKGMVLQIVEETLSDGTQGITQVRIISQ